MSFILYILSIYGAPPKRSSKNLEAKMCVKHGKCHVFVRNIGFGGATIYTHTYIYICTYYPELFTRIKIHILVMPLFSDQVKSHSVEVCPFTHARRQRVCCTFSYLIFREKPHIQSSPPEESRQHDPNNHLPCILQMLLATILK